MTAPEMVLPSVEVSLHELRAAAVTQLIPMSAYIQIRTYVELPADTHPLIRATYRAGAAACLLTFGALLPEGVFPALAAVILHPAGGE